MSQTPSPDFQMSCPRPLEESDRVRLAHGGGGILMQRLLEKVFYPAFSNKNLNTRHDGSVLQVGDRRLAFTTDSYVVNPLFFPGGDIGRLAVFGTVNDLSMCGAKPLWLSAGFILEEGFDMDKLTRIVASMRDAAREAGVEIVTGDTKVVDKGKGDGIFINTAGIGLVETPLKVEPASVRPDDVILLSGDLGRHGIAIMAQREGLQFESTIQSDLANLAPAVKELLDAGVRVHCLRDLTRGGLTSALNEIAEASGLTMHVDEKAIAVTEEVRGACEILGLDPLYVANEGRFIAFVERTQQKKALEVIHKHFPTAGGAVIGKVDVQGPARVMLQSSLGTTRILDRLSGEQLPRIC